MSLRHVLICFALFAMLAVSCPCFGDNTAEQRHPLPSESQQGEIGKIVHEIYGEQLSAARTLIEREALAKTMFQTATQTNDPNEKYMLLDVALETAISSKSLDITMEIVERIAEQYDIDSHELKIKTLATLTHNTYSQSQAKLLAGYLLPLVGEATKESELEKASEANQLFGIAASRSKDRELIQQYQHLRGLLDRFRSVASKVKAAKATLETSPNEGKANQTLGEYYCFLQGDWQTGLPYLAKSNDQELRSIAQQDLDAETPEAKLDAVNRWWDYAESFDTNRQDVEQANLRRYALENYKNLLDRNTGLKRTWIANRIQECEAEHVATALPLLKLSSPDIDCSAWADLKRGINSRVLTGYQDVLDNIAFSPDGKYVAAAGGYWEKKRLKDASVRVWDVETGNTLHVLKGHQDMVLDTAFSPDGKYLASASKDNTIRIWTLKTGQLFRVLTGNNDWARCVTFSPDSKYLASSFADHTICVWNAKTGKPLYVLKGHEETPNSLAFSPDGNTLASCANDQTVRLWNLRTREAIHIMKGHRYRIVNLSFAPDGKTVASSSWDQATIIWDVATGNIIHLLLRSTGRRYGNAFSPDGKYLVDGSRDKIVRIWSTQTGKQIRYLKGHTASVTGVTFSPDGKRIATCSEDHTVRIWEMGEKKAESK